MFFRFVFSLIWFLLFGDYRCRRYGHIPHRRSPNKPVTCWRCKQVLTEQEVARIQVAAGRW